MPERGKLTAEVLQEVMATIPENSWAAVAMSSGEIVATGSTMFDALVQAREKRPDVKRGQLAMILKREGKSRKRR